MHGLVNDGPLAYEYEVTSLLCALGIQWAKWNFIDVGANIGYFPVILKSLFGESLRVDAFEPHPSIAAMCTSGTSEWYDSAKTHQIALSSESGTAKFYLSAKTDTSNSLNSRFRSHKEVIDIEVSTLDEFFFDGAKFTMFDPENPTVLKIDVESTEPDVLSGGTRFIEAHRPHIICEVLAGRTEDQLNEFCSKNRYTPIRLTRQSMYVEASVFGDRTYEFRDWYLSPSELSETTERNFTVFSGINSLHLHRAQPTSSALRRLQKLRRSVPLELLSRRSLRTTR